MLSKSTQTSEDLSKTSTELKLEEKDDCDPLPILKPTMVSKSTSTEPSESVVEMNVIKNEFDEEIINDNDFHLVNAYTDEVTSSPIKVPDDELRTIPTRILNKRLRKMGCTKE